MSAELAEFEHEGSWKGGSKPFGPSYGKLMMWFFLVSDAFTFGTFLIAYGGLRFTQDWWPDPAEVFSSFPGIDGHLPLAFVTLMTFILIASSYTMVMAVYEGHHGNRKSVIWWLLATVVGGAAFLGCQAIEWTHLMHQGLSFWNNPFQPGADGISTVVRSAEELAIVSAHDIKAINFGQLFFVITGFHGSHVLSGVVLMIIILANAVGGTYERRGHYEMVEKVGLYWHFVDLVWVFVFLVFYLI